MLFLITTAEPMTMVMAEFKPLPIPGMPNLTLMPQKYNDIEPALGLTDIRRKRELVPYFRGEACTRRIRWAGRMEQLQRKYLQTVVGGLPSLPFIFYRVMCKLPDWRNIILK